MEINTYGNTSMTIFAATLVLFYLGGKVEG